MASEITSSSGHQTRSAQRKGEEGEVSSPLFILPSVCPFIIRFPAHQAGRQGYEMDVVVPPPGAHGLGSRGLSGDISRAEVA